MPSSPAPPRFVRRVGLSLALAGIDPRTTLRAARRSIRYARDYRQFIQLSASAGLGEPQLRHSLPALADAGEQAGTSTSEYFLADLWAAQKIHAAAPARHLDVGSRIDGLVAHLLSFREVEVVDIRPLESSIPGLRFVQADATSLAGISDASWPSVSSIHALEHFGLGRYGDTLDPAGHIAGLTALGRVTAVGGDLYVGFPVGRPRVEFNAHRVLSPSLVASVLPDFHCVSFAAIVDGELRADAEIDDLVDLEYACGLYHLQRTATSS